MKKVALGATLAVLLTAATGCTAAAGPAAPTGYLSASASAHPRPIRVAVVGDSLTAVASKDFASGEIDDASWVRQLDRDGSLEFVGGWAARGATTADMRLHVREVPCDVLIILAGTNDVRQRVALTDTINNLLLIARTVNAPRVVLSAIPPQDDRPDEVVAFNRAMDFFAASAGWLRTDPWLSLQNGDLYRTGATTDGIHPTDEGEQVIGQMMRSFVELSIPQPVSTEPSS